MNENKKTGTELIFRIIVNENDLKEIKQRFDLSLNLFELKRLILNLTENKPFLLDEFMPNFNTAKHFVDKLNSNTINVYLDRENFSLSITPNSNLEGFKELFTITGLNTNS